MKREIIIAAILLLTVGILINCRTQKRQFSELVHSNVEALSFNEWGGVETIWEAVYLLGTNTIGLISSYTIAIILSLVPTRLFMISVNAM